MDLLLFNGFTPRRRSPGDLFLDNGIGVLRAALRRAGVDFEIEDRMTVNGYDEFRTPWISAALRRLFARVVFPKGKISLPAKLACAVAIKVLYSAAARRQDRRMHAYLRRLADRIGREQIPVLGIKLWFGSTFDFSVRLCEWVRRASPETLVVVGGPQANCFYQDGLILKHTDFDLAVYSEGEEALVEIVRLARQYRTRSERLAAIRNAGLPNLVFRDGADVKVNPVRALPINEKTIPEYEAGELDLKFRSHTIIDGLGCDYGKCAFCIHPHIYPKCRLRDPALVVDEMETMLRRGIGFFTFTASDTPLPHARKISREILRRGLRVEYTMLTRAVRNARNRRDHLVESFREIIRAGMRILFMGAECGNDDVLRSVLNKGVTVDDIAETVLAAREAARLEQRRIYIITSFIFPLPLTDELIARGLTLDQVFADNVRLAERMQPDSFQVIPAILYAGTRWHREAEKFNFFCDTATFGATMLRAEISVHALVDKSLPAPYGFMGRPFKEWLPLHARLSRTINDLGIPSELNDEHILIARCLDAKGPGELEEISKNLFLDVVSSDYDNSAEYLRRVNDKSREIAALNFTAEDSFDPLPLRQPAPQREWATAAAG